MKNNNTQGLLKKYWSQNVLIMFVLLSLWALAGLGAGIFFVDWLNLFKLPTTGFPLGFWFAHQGSIIAFVLLILIYCLLMNYLDSKYHSDLNRFQNNK